MRDMVSTNPIPTPETRTKRTWMTLLIILSLLVSLYLVNVDVDSDLKSRLLKRKKNNRRRNPIMTQKILTTKRFFTPSDMWKNPSEDPSWNPYKLPDCCNYHAKSIQNDYNPPISTEFYTCKRRDAPLRYIGPGAGLTPEDLKTALRRHKGDVILMGDSLMRQWFGHLACYLGSWDLPRIQFRGHDFKDEITKLLKNQPKWERDNLDNFLRQGKSSFLYFDIPSMDANITTVKRVISHTTIGYSIEERADLLFFYDRVYPREYGRERPLFLINAGIHFNDNDSRLHNMLQVMYNICREGGLKCIFRETTPQHFQNPDGNGLYTKSPIWNRKACSEPPKSFQELSGWRNDVLHNVVSNTDNSIETKGGGFVTIMPLFERLAFLSFAHSKGRNRGKNDCTHFAHNPEYWEPWHVSLTQTLNDLHKVVATV